MRIETDRLTVRPFALSDAADLQEILGDAETMRFCEPPYSPEQTARFLSEFCIGRGGALAAERRADGKVIGYLLLSGLDSGCCEMGWFFNRAVWGMGFAHEACAAVVRHAFTAPAVRRVWCETIDPGRSAALARKLGMRPEGVQRQHVRTPGGDWADVYLFGLLREDYWKANEV